MWSRHSLFPSRQFRLSSNCRRATIPAFSVFKCQGDGRLDGNPDNLLPTGETLAATSSASAVAAAPSPDGAAQKRAYPPVAAVPTQHAPKGVRFDFNEGCRVMLPEDEHLWRVRISDLDTGNILYETEIKAGRVSSTKRYYVRFAIE